MSMLAAANSIAKLSFNLQPRLVFLSRLRYGIRCFAADANHSGFPVRYIPMKRADAKQTQGSSSRDDSRKDSGHSTLGKRSTIRHQKSSARLLGDSEQGLNQDPEKTQHWRRHFKEDVDELQTQWHPYNQHVSYVSEALDSEYVKVPKEASRDLQTDTSVIPGEWSKLSREMSCHDGVLDSEFMEASEEAVEEIQTTESGGGRGEQGWPKSCGTRQEAEKLAIGLLAKRGFTAVELRKKLLSKHFPLSIVEVVIHDFLKRGLINDRLYAETFSKSRWTSSSWGPRRIKHALSKKGVSEVDAEKALKLVFENGEEDDSEQNASTRLSGSSMEQLYMQAFKHWQRSENASPEIRKARVIRWLQYRGFDWVVVGIILKKLQSGHPP